MYARLLSKWEAAYLYLRFVLRHLPTPIMLPLVNQDNRDADALADAQLTLLRVPALLELLRPTYGDELVDAAVRAADRLLICYRLIAIVGDSEGKLGGGVAAPGYGFLYRSLPDMIRDADQAARTAGIILAKRPDTWGS